MATIHDDDSFEFTTPAKGDGYDFSVAVRIDWCVSGHRWEEDLEEELDEFRKTAQERIENLVRPVARRWHPFEAEAAEEEIARTLTRWCDGEGVVRGTARARVSPAEAVRDVQKGLSLKLHELAGEAERARMLVKNLTELRALWHDFLKASLDDWMTVHAVQLAERPADVADQVRLMLQERRDHAETTAAWLSEHHEQFHQLDACTFLTSSDSTLRELLKLLDVPVPDIEPSSFFARPIGPPNGSAN